MKSKIALAVAVALAILTAVGIKAYLKQQAEKNRGETKTVNILVAAKGMKAGDTVFRDSVREVAVDQRMVRDRRTILASDALKIMGKKITKKVVSENDPLYWSYFSADSKRLDPARNTPEGFRQVTIPVDKVTGCAGRLLPGTVVDVLVTLRVRTSPERPVEPVTQTVLTGMRVVATDLHSAEVSDFRSARQRRDYAAYSTVTLRALPLQASLLAFLADQGKLHLVIRSPGDATGMDPSKLDKITLDDLDTLIRKAASERPVAAPTPRPPGPRR